MTTTQLTALYEHDYASWINRGAALIVDGIGLFLAYLFIVQLTGIGSGEANSRVAAPIALALTALYFVISHARFGQTVGKRLFAIKVVAAENPERNITYLRALARWAVVWVAGWFILPAFVDYLWAFRDDRKQTLHDKLVRSLVVRTT